MNDIFVLKLSELKPDDLIVVKSEITNEGVKQIKDYVTEKRGFTPTVLVMD